MNRSPRVTFSRSLTKQFVQKTEGDYENDNFRVMVTAVAEYLSGKKNAQLILREFYKFEQVLEAKARQLWQQGKDKRPKW